MAPKKTSSPANTLYALSRYTWDKDRAIENSGEFFSPGEAVPASMHKGGSEKVVKKRKSAKSEEAPAKAAKPNGSAKNGKSNGASKSSGTSAKKAKSNGTAKASKPKQPKKADSKPAAKAPSAKAAAAKAAAVDAAKVDAAADALDVSDHCPVIVDFSLR